MQNVFADIPYGDPMGKRQLVNETHLRVMQLALKPGQEVPSHTADSNVQMLVIEGAVVVTIDDESSAVTRGDLLAVDYLATMGVRNDSDADASFLVFKAPNPDQMA